MAIRSGEMEEANGRGGMATLNSDYLLGLARDKSIEGRQMLAGSISDLFEGKSETLSDRERTLMYDIMHQMVHDTEMSVRKIISSRIAAAPHAPKDLVLMLANDEIEVAFPVLSKCELLQDEELIEIIRQRAVEHQLAISIRHTVSEKVSDALVQDGDESVITSLLENSGAKISTKTMEFLVDESRRVNAYQEPILRRDDLDPQFAKRMYMWVSAALRTHIIENFDVDKSELDQILEAAAIEASGTEIKEGPRDKSDDLADELAEEDAVTPDLLLGALRNGQVHLFVSLFRRHTGLRKALITRFVLEATGEGLAIACKATGFNKKQFSEIYELCGTVQSKSGRTREGDNGAVFELFDEINEAAASQVIEHWRRDVDYLSAIRALSPTGDESAGFQRH